MACGRSVGPRHRRAETPAAPEPGVPLGVSPGSLLPQAGHSLGYAGTNEGQVNSANRRTKDSMGIVRTTPPCDGNVLGPPGRVLQGQRGGSRRPTILTQGPGRPATVVPSAHAQTVSGRGARAAEARPLLGPRAGGGATTPAAPRPVAHALLCPRSFVRSASLDALTPRHPEALTPRRPDALSSGAPADWERQASAHSGELGL